VRTDRVLGVRIEGEDRTVVLVGKPRAGTWTVQPAADSVPIARLQRAGALAPARVRGQVGGTGASRVLRYDIPHVPGQVVDLIEEGVQGGQRLRTVRSGGKGTVRFTTAEAQGTHRAIVAQVQQDGLPRARLVVARFVAPSPQVGRPGRVGVRRAGRRAVITWGTALGAQTYEIVVTGTDGRRVLLAAPRGTRSVSVPAPGRGERLIATVRGLSPTGRRGPARTATLRPAPRR
jgi:hypothetical protein